MKTKTQKHTKGPFVRVGSDVRIEDRGKDGYSIGHSDSDDNTPMDRMIACANACEGIDPAAIKDLLKAAKKVVGFAVNLREGGPNKPIHSSFLIELRAAIAKADPK